MSDNRDPLRSAARARLEALYNDYATSVYGYSRSRLSEPDAEDVTAEVFRSAAERLRVEPDLAVDRAWLLNAARNRIIDRWRYRMRWDGRLEILRRDIEPDMERASSEAEDRVVDTLERLPEEHRAVLVLRYVDGYSSREIADAIGRSTPAVDSLLARARRGLIAAFDEVAS